MSPALAGQFLSTAPPGKSHGLWIFFYVFFFFFNLAALGLSCGIKDLFVVAGGFRAYRLSSCIAQV